MKIGKSIHERLSIAGTKGSKLPNQISQLCGNSAFELTGLKLNDFVGKKALDIGAGFGDFFTLISRRLGNKADLTQVDPCYKNCNDKGDFEAYMRHNFIYFKNRLDQLKKSKKSNKQPKNKFIHVDEKHVRRCANSVTNLKNPIFSSRINKIAGMAENLPLKENTFDLVFINAILNEIDNNRYFRIFDEIERVLSFNGEVFISVYSKFNFFDSIKNVDISYRQYYTLRGNNEDNRVLNVRLRKIDLPVLKQQLLQKFGNVSENELNEPFFTALQKHNEEHLNN